MSRQSMMPSRNLTLTEELEKLEQSITLTLQEIDHNFSRAHRIVSGSIIPIVEQYAKHSDAVWDGAKFWKQFFEASANVSLSSYEEAAEEDLTAVDQTQTTEGQDEYGTPVKAGEGDDTVTTSEERPSPRFEGQLEGSSLLDSPSVTVKQNQASTPQNGVRSNQKQRYKKHEETSFAEYTSPYETLKTEMDRNGRTRTVNPETPGRSVQTPRTETSPPASNLSTARQAHPSRQQNADPLLHRVLDKNWRVIATPHTTRRKAASPQKNAQTPTANATVTQTQNPALDSSPFSPEPAAPQLRSDIFGSPGGPRTPGISVQKGKGKTPRRVGDSARKTLFASEFNQDRKEDMTATERISYGERMWDSDSDTNEFDEFGDISPPKTMQFHIPRSKLTQTPAKEASKRIVEDLLSTAGIGSVTSTLDDLDLGEGNAQEDDNDEERYHVGTEDSPSIVRMAPRRVEDEEF